MVYGVWWTCLIAFGLGHGLYGVCLSEDCYVFSDTFRQPVHYFHFPTLPISPYFPFPHTSHLPMLATSFMSGEVLKGLTVYTELSQYIKAKHYIRMR